MESKDAAVRAIIATHGAQIDGYTVKCSWGKEMTDSQNQQQSSSSSSSMSQNQVPPPQSVRIPLTAISFHRLYSKFERMQNVRQIGRIRVVDIKGMAFQILWSSIT